jgi:hypothetical protein
MAERPGQRIGYDLNIPRHPSTLPTGKLNRESGLRQNRAQSGGKKERVGRDSASQAEHAVALHGLIGRRGFAF